MNRRAVLWLGAALWAGACGQDERIGGGSGAEVPVPIPDAGMKDSSTPQPDGSTPDAVAPKRTVFTRNPFGNVGAKDNMLWDGKVADPSATDDDTEALRALTRTVRDDARVSFSLVPIGDGLGLARKRG